VEFSHEQQQLLHYQELLAEKQLLYNELKQKYDQQIHMLRSMESDFRGQQIRSDQHQQLMEKRALCQQHWNDLQTVLKQQREVQHQFIMLGVVSEQQLLEYEQQLIGIEQQLKPQYEQEYQRLQSMELSSVGPQFGHELLEQRALCQQLQDDLQIVLKRRQEFQHKFMLQGESAPQASSQDQKAILQDGQWVPVPEAPKQQQQHQQGLQPNKMMLQGGQWIPMGPDQQQQQGKPPQQSLQGADNTQWSGGDQQPVDEQRRLQAEQQQKEHEQLLQSGVQTTHHKEQDKEQILQQHRQQPEQHQRREGQLKEGERMKPSQIEGQDGLSNGSEVSSVVILASPSPSTLPNVSQLAGKTAPITSFVHTYQQSQVYSGAKEELSAAGDNPPAAMLPNAQQQQGPLTPNPQGSPAADTSCALHHSDSGQDSHPLGAKDAATQSQSAVSTKQKQSNPMDSDHNGKPTNEANGNHTAGRDAGDKNENDLTATPASDFPEPQSTMCTQSEYDIIDLPLVHGSGEDSKNVTNEKRERGREEGVQNKTYAAAVAINEVFLLYMSCLTMYTV
jgi:hypothetical protein